MLPHFLNALLNRASIKTTQHFVAVQSTNSYIKFNGKTAYL